mmetsp:Transcript_17657/g.29836  ORF Transcript_17657/g.29836 Transcript_17657/m.29836 type:complete len:203 (-) Transcript_17657:18-626(-)
MEYAPGDLPLTQNFDYSYHSLLAVNDQMAVKRAEFARYEVDKAAYEVLKEAYNAAIVPKQANFFEILFGIDKLEFKDVPARPTPPQVPSPYAGASFSHYGLLHDHGLGKLTATKTSPGFASKSFGVLGFGAPDKGAKIPPEDPSDCAASYLAVSLVPLDDSITGDYSIVVGANAWRSDLNLVVPVTPTAATEPNVPNMADFY